MAAARFRQARRAASALAMLLTCGHALAQTAPANVRNFVACPKVMDTQDAPCWVAEYQGERYFLTVQTGRGGASAEGWTMPPELRHKALIEGVVSDEPRICGGIVLRPVKISTLADDMDDSCNDMLPAQGYHTTSARAIGLDGDPPPPGVARTVNGSFGQRKGENKREALYARNAAARTPMTFTIKYFFGSTYLMYPIEQENVEDALDYAKKMNASHIEVVGHRGEAVLSAGGLFPEKPGLAEQRARNIGDILINFGWPPEKLTVRWTDKPENNGGFEDYRMRRTEISVQP